MKKVLLVLLVFALVFSVPAGVMAQDEVKVVLDGNPMEFEIAPQIENDRTLVPLRAIFEAVGADVEWDGETNTVTATKGDIVVILTIGDTNPTINGVVTPIDQPAIIVSDRTLAPMRFVAEAFGGNVDWDPDTYTAYITSPEATSDDNNVPEENAEEDANSEGDAATEGDDAVEEDANAETDEE